MQWIGAVLIGLLSLMLAGAPAPALAIGCFLDKPPPWTGTPHCTMAKPLVLVTGQLTSDPMSPQRHCTATFSVCGSHFKKTEEVTAGAPCFGGRKFSAPPVCCREWRKAVKNHKGGCNPAADANCDGIPNESENDPFGSVGYVFVTAHAPTSYSNPSTNSPKRKALACGLRVLAFDSADVDGQRWIQVQLPASTTRVWTPVSNLSCRPPKEVPTRPPGTFKMIDSGVENVRATSSMTAAASGGDEEWIFCH